MVLFVDATILRMFPPLRHAWGWRGQQTPVRITGANARRVLVGALNPRTGHRVLMRRRQMRQGDFQAFLRELRGRYGNRRLVLLLDKESTHTAPRSQGLAIRLDIWMIWLPKQRPELNIMDQLWKEAKRAVVVNRQYRTIDIAADRVETWIMRLSPREALRKAGVLAPKFWLRRLFSKDFWPPT